MAPQAYRIATVQIVVRADSEAESADAISELLSGARENEAILDWAYLRLGGQLLYGTERFLNPLDYEEGEAF